MSCFYVVQCKCNAFLVNSEVSNFTNLSQFQFFFYEFLNPHHEFELTIRKMVD